MEVRWLTAEGHLPATACAVEVGRELAVGGGSICSWIESCEEAGTHARCMGGSAPPLLLSARGACTARGAADGGVVRRTAADTCTSCSTQHELKFLELVVFVVWTFRFALQNISSLKQYIETAREDSILAVATTISPSCHPSLCVLLSMDSITMARSMIKALELPGLVISPPQSSASAFQTHFATAV